MPKAPGVPVSLPGSMPGIPAPDLPLVNMKLPDGVRESDALTSQIYSPQGEFSVSFSCRSQLLIVLTQLEDSGIPDFKASCYFG